MGDLSHKESPHGPVNQHVPFPLPTSANYAVLVTIQGAGPLPARAFRVHSTEDSVEQGNRRLHEFSLTRRNALVCGGSIGSPTMSRELLTNSPTCLT